MNKSPKNQNKTYLPEAAAVIGVVFELGFIIALPIVFLGSLGKWLDNRYGTKHFILLGIAFAIISSILWVYKRLSPMIEKLNKAVNKSINKEQDKQDNKE